MPSPRIAEPSIPKDGRSIVQDNTASDVFAALAPTVAQIGVNYIGNEMQNKAIQEIGANLQATKDALLQQTSAPRPPEADAAVSDYARRVSNVNSAVDQGKIGANAAKTRIDALTREYARRFPAFASEFTDRNSQLEDTITTAFQQDATIAAASQRAEEDAKVRADVASHGFNPDDARDVQAYMILKQEAFVSSVLKARYERDAAKKADAAAAAASFAQTRMTSEFLTFLTDWNKEQEAALRNGGDPVKVFAERKARLPALFGQLVLRMQNEVPQGPDQDRIYSQFKSLFDTVKDAGDITQVQTVTSALVESAKNRAFFSQWTSLNQETQGVIAVLGPQFSEVLQNLHNLQANRDNYIRSIGKENFDIIMRATTDLFGGRVPTDGQRAEVEDTSAEVLAGRAPPSKEGAAIGQILLNGGARLTPEQANNVVSAISQGGQVIPMHYWTRQDRIRTLAMVKDNPAVQRQVAREVALSRQYFSQNPDARLIMREEPNGSTTWNIVDKGRVLLSSKQPTNEQGGVVSQAWPDAIRDTLNAGSILGNQGIIFSDLDRLFSDLNPAVNPVQPPSSTRPAGRSAGNR